MSKYLGEFNVISGMLVMSDPSFVRGTWCQAVVKAKSGFWRAHASYTPEGDIRRLFAHHYEHEVSEEELADTGSALKSQLITEAGYMSIHDAETYRNNDHTVPVKDPYSKIPGDEWACMWLDRVKGEGQAGLGPYGVFAQAEKDGEYEAYGLVEEPVGYVAVMIPVRV